MSSDCLQLPQHLKYRHYRGRPQFNSSVLQPLHSQKSTSRYLISSSTHNSWILKNMKSPSAPFPINMAPSPNWSRNSSTILNPPKKIGSQITIRSWYKTAISIRFYGGHVLISDFKLDISHALSGNSNMHLYPVFSWKISTQLLSRNMEFLSHRLLDIYGRYIHCSKLGILSTWK